MIEKPVPKDDSVIAKVQVKKLVISKLDNGIHDLQEFRILKDHTTNRSHNLRDNLLG